MDAQNRRTTALLLALALGGSVLACTSHWRGAAGRAPVQGWWQERGPVVPHDSFPSDCTLCHEGDDWHTIRRDFVFDHAKETGVPLRGAHALAECLRCHNDRGSVALFAQRGCVGCHEDVHRGQLGPDCSSCHGEDSWRPEGTLAMHAETRLPLIGAHVSVQCWACHPGAEVGNFRNASPECVNCHLDDYQATTDPDHEAEGFPLTCNDCHGFSSFDTAIAFTHAGITNDCVRCHLPDYQATNDPDHAADGIPTTCEQCHNTRTWSGATFNHAGISAGCVQCHLPEYQGTRDPNHAALAFPTTCEQCHSSFTTWQGALFDHSGIAGDCARCHLADFQTAAEPDHVAAGFQPVCEQCHASTTTWQGGRYDAHQFPIYSGAHRGFDCGECHLGNTSYQIFSCTHCHAHRQSAMDDKHAGRSGYVWESTTCYHCHPDGRG